MNPKIKETIKRIFKPKRSENTVKRKPVITPNGARIQRELDYEKRLAQKRSRLSRLQ